MKKSKKRHAALIKTISINLCFLTHTDLLGVGWRTFEEKRCDGHSRTL